MSGSRASAEATLGDESLEASSRIDPEALLSGAHVGRYVVLGRIGSGGMGVVYAAHDPELDRKVALKLLRPGGTGRQTTIGRARLVREAQAMARLAHPNVVTIHDVGEHDGAVYLAMEFVAGRTLRAWMDEGPHGWAEVLAVFVPAARGLAAAHDAELVHRDFKPDNVMVADDGRVLVMDFGLARSKHEVPSSEEVARREPETSADPLATPLTQEGSIIGTPAYMAPEQHLSLRTDARTDQFSFCVSLFEALYGVRPFDGTTAAAVAFNVTQGTIRGSAGGRSIPRWVRAVCLRGLKPTPDDRHRDMHALLDELDRGRARVRRRRITLGIGALALLAGGQAYGERLAEQHRRDACASMGHAIDEDWNDQARRRLTEALVATGAPGAPATAAKTVAWLDGWAGAWRRTRVETCLASEVEGTMDPPLRARADACLTERRIRFDALTTELSRADARVVRAAVSAASSLPSVQPCADPHALATWPILPAEATEDAEGILRRLSAATAASAAGRYEEGLQVATAALADADALGFEPLQAEAQRLAGSLHADLGDYARAEASLTEAYLLGQSAGAPRVAADAATSLIHVVGIERARHGEALVWAKAAQAAIASLEPEPGLRTARRIGNLATVHDALGEYDLAVEEHERGLGIREATLGADHPETASALAHLAATHRMRGELDRAEALHRRVLEIRQSVFGPEHPAVATSMSSLALLDVDRGRYDDAIEGLQAALAIAERAYGPNHPDVADLLGSLAAAHRAQRDPKTAMPLYERALEIRRATLGPDHPDVGRTLNNMATAHHMLGQYDEEKAALTEALRIWERAVGDSHPDLAPLLVNLGKSYEADEDFDTARAMYERALQIRRVALGPDHVKLAYVHVGLGNVAMAQERFADALVHAERAVTLRDGGRAPGPELAEARFLLARATWAADPADGGDRAKGLALAREVAAEFRRTKGMDGPAAFVEGWIDDHAD